MITAVTLARAGLSLGASLLLGAWLASPAAAQHDSVAGLQPAGLFWTGYDTCFGECTAPTAAVVLAVDETAERAQARLAETPRGPLPAGYPLVVHTDELDLTAPGSARPRGVATVLGLFATAADAEAWVAGLPDPLSRARIVALPGRPVSLLYEGGGPPESLPQRVVRVRAGAPVPGYDPAEVQAALASGDWSGDTAELVGGAGLAPVCEVPGDSLVVTPSSELDANYYLFAPARCGERAVWVRWRDTWLDALVLTTAAGEVRVRQVTGADCDSPGFTEWRYGPNGLVVVSDDPPGCAY